jgi:hypothetical protein
VPGPNANWSATNYNDFAKSIQALGDKLVERIEASGSGDCINYKPNLEAANTISRISPRTGRCCATAAGCVFGCVTIVAEAVSSELCGKRLVGSIA